MATRRALVPEVVQTSGMDCGPAALTAILRGHGLRASYDLVRASCQTDVDGTSVDALEDLANRLGLRAEQVSVPLDHVFADETSALPCIAVTLTSRQALHFVVVWSRRAGLVQLMDPAVGRRWSRTEAFLRDVYEHAMPADAAAWREWAGSPEFLRPLERRLRGVVGAAAGGLLAEALADPEADGLASLDAATRFVHALRLAGAVDDERGALGLVAALLASCREPGADLLALIPANYWHARPLARAADAPAQLEVRGAILVRVAGLASDRAPALDADATDDAPPRPRVYAEGPDPFTSALRRLGEGAGAALAGLGVALALVLLVATVEALLYRSLLDLLGRLSLVRQRVFVGALLVQLAALGAAASAVSIGLSQWIARRFDFRLRLELFSRIPRLGDAYFRSRPASDLAERGHQIHQLRSLPEVAAQLLSALGGVALATACVAWVDRASGLRALVVGAAVIALPCLLWPALLERDLRVRTHAGAMSRFGFDALLGIEAARAHGAERAIRDQHEHILLEWFDAVQSRLRLVTVAESLQSLAATLGQVWILFAWVRGGGDGRTALLLLFWTQSYAVFGQDIVAALRELPTMRSVLGRIGEPLVAPVEPVPAEGDSARMLRPGGVAIEFDRATVVVAGHTILDALELRIGAGEHVAVVGPSGSGKSSLLGVLLGFFRPASGEVRVDGAPLDAAQVTALRRVTGWVDPGVEIWNESLLENVRYGVHPTRSPDLASAVARSDLVEVIARLPEGLQTPLGEGGSLVSGGEGQRVRLARALARTDVRLALLDEPFRGLEAARREKLVAAVRAHWRDTTVVYVTHDVDEALHFGRVLVVDGGRIAEDGEPGALLADEASRFAAMFAAHRALRATWDDAARWRRVRVADGALREEAPEP